MSNTCRSFVCLRGVSILFAAFVALCSTHCGTAGTPGSSEGGSVGTGGSGAECPPGDSVCEIAEGRFGAQGVNVLNYIDSAAMVELGGIGITWGRYAAADDVMRFTIESGDIYDFSRSDPAVAAAVSNGIGMVGQLTSQRRGNRNDPLVTEDEINQFKAYVGAVVERYDGDVDFGVAEGEPTYPDCDTDQNGSISIEEKESWAAAHRYYAWELMKEPLPPERANGPAQVGFLAEEVAVVLQAGSEAIKAADPNGLVLFGGLAPGPMGGVEATKTYLTNILAAGGAAAIDILGVDAFTDPPDEMLEMHRSVMGSLYLDIPLWVVQLGTNAGGCGHNPWGGSPENQAKYVVKGFSLAFAAGAEKVFWGNFAASTSEFESECMAFNVWENYALIISNQVGIEKRPGFHTYALMIAKLEGATLTPVDLDNVFKFTRSDGSAVFVAWSDAGNQQLDLSEQVVDSQVTVTHVITAQGQTEPTVLTHPADAIPINDSPVFIE